MLCYLTPEQCQSRSQHVKTQLAALSESAKTCSEAEQDYLEDCQLLLSRLTVQRTVTGEEMQLLEGKVNFLEEEIQRFQERESQPMWYAGIFSR